MNAAHTYANTRLQNLIAFVESHGNKVVSHTDTSITAEIVLCEADGKSHTAQETFPATLQAARDWLGY